MSPDRGVIYVVLDHFARHLYPRALDMDRRLRNGEPLSGSDLDHVAQVLEDIRMLRPLIDRHPEHADIAAGVIDLYAHIARRARDNENTAGTSPKE